MPSSSFLAKSSVSHRRLPTLAAYRLAWAAASRRVGRQQLAEWLMKRLGLLGHERRQVDHGCGAEPVKLMMALEARVHSSPAPLGA